MDTFGRTFMLFDTDLRPPTSWWSIWYQIRLRVVWPFRPIARYVGKVMLFDRHFSFTGKDKKESSDYKLDVPYSLITDTHLGFDDRYTKAIDVSLALSDYTKPLRVSFVCDNRLMTAYFLTDFSYGVGGPSINSSNERFLRLLRERIERCNDRLK